MKFPDMKGVLPLFLISTVVGCTFCEAAFATDFSIDAVHFKEKLPSPNGDLGASLVGNGESVGVLKNDIKAIDSLKESYRIEIIGHTDNQECVPHECERLSLRRAQRVYDWMLANGVSRSRLLPPEGHGSGGPVANNEILGGRAMNRYVEFQVVPKEAGP
ncbi:OmpA family protein [Rhodanobacter sp. 7MK24]|uniref:OmpA family protein n=1 Tax=Rhodanobacter sp. 7MK24 TaxID=2775922 RepID=UPI00177DB585|nr:OmpA family protein [Rhodanobacter sp. 7MK24]